MLTAFPEHSFGMYVFKYGAKGPCGNGDCLGWLIPRSTALAIFLSFLRQAAKCQ